MDLKRHIPNMFTFFNLSLGMVAIMICVNNTNSLELSALFILTACFMDRFDGKMARKLGVTSDLGKELDSLSDLISFGVAPALLAWKLILINMGILGYLIVLIFPIAGAYRLARFNVTPFSNIYSGIPITVAGGLLAIFDLYCMKYMNKTTRITEIITIVFMILLSYLMVSNLKMKKR